VKRKKGAWDENEIEHMDNSVFGIRFQNPDLGAASDGLIPQAQGKFDSLGIDQSLHGLSREQYSDFPQNATT
jgi:hypothetical protein